MRDATKLTDDDIPRLRDPSFPRFGRASSRPGCTVGIFRPKLQTLKIVIYVPPPIDVSDTFFFGFVHHNTLTVDLDRRSGKHPREPVRLALCE
jgi:hypothetical protein